MSAEHEKGNRIEAEREPIGVGLTHLDDDGAARMVDVGAKDVSERVAVAEARVRMSTDAAAAVERGPHAAAAEVPADHDLLDAQHLDRVLEHR